MGSGSASETVFRRSSLRGRIEPVEIDVQHLVGTRGGVSGWSSGHARDSQDTLEFSDLRGITPKIETFPLAEVSTAYERMIENETRFRVVLEP